MNALVRALALVLLAVALPAAATSSLTFDGEGYLIDMEIGDDTAPVIASIRFHVPGDDAGKVLPAAEWRVVRFDPTKRVLVIRHDAGNSGVGPFSLAVEGASAVLAIDGLEIHSGFDWQQ